MMAGVFFHRSQVRLIALAKRSEAIARKRRRLPEMRRDDGAVSVFFAVTMPVLMMIALIIVDVGRINNLHLDLQSGADALALAAATELDGTSTAIDRADLALATLVKNQARFADGGGVIIDSINGQNIGNAQLEVDYLSGLPSDDDDWALGAYITTDPLEAAFAWVRITPLTYSVLFPVQFVLGNTTLPVEAQAVAGYSPAVCDFTPMFICNPYEGTGETLEDAVSTVAARRRMIEMRQKGPSASYAPGNFGYLKPPTGNPGASNFAKTLAAVKPNACFGARGVELRTGEAVGPVRNAINVRFDLYKGFFNSPTYKNSPNYRPARSVRKGYEPAPGNSCNAPPADNYGEEPSGPAPYMAMPRDNCFYDTNGTYPCTQMDGRMGDGFWKFEDYWNSNFPGVAIPNGWTDANPPTRYEVYRYEVDNNLIDTRSIGDPPPPDNGENGAPACYGGGSETLSDDPDRRLLYGAILNCLEYADEMNGTSGDPIPVEAFGSFYLTEPVQQGGPDEDVIRAELVDITGRYGNDTLANFERDNVQLYR